MVRIFPVKILYVELVAACIVGVPGEWIVRNEVTGDSIETLYQDFYRFLGEQTLVIANFHREFKNAFCGWSDPIYGIACSFEEATGCSPSVSQRVVVSITGKTSKLECFAGRAIRHTFPPRLVFSPSAQWNE